MERKAKERNRDERKKKKKGIVHDGKVMFRSRGREQAFALSSPMG